MLLLQRLNLVHVPEIVRPVGEVGEVCHDDDGEVAKMVERLASRARLRRKNLAGISNLDQLGADIRWMALLQLSTKILACF